MRYLRTAQALLSSRWVMPPLLRSVRRERGWRASWCVIREDTLETGSSKSSAASLPQGEYGAIYIFLALQLVLAVDVASLPASCTVTIPLLLLSLHVHERLRFYYF